jgi:hypothetical protein
MMNFLYVLQLFMSLWTAAHLGLGRRQESGEDYIYELYSLPNIIQVIKATRMTWAEHVACMGDRRGAYSVLTARPEKKRPLWKT